jgi:hypothetical protein
MSMLFVLVVVLICCFVECVAGVDYVVDVVEFAVDDDVLC